jgi:hypothetical protein
MLDIYANKFELYNIECCFCVETHVLSTEDTLEITVGEGISNKMVPITAQNVENFIWA